MQISQRFLGQCIQSPSFGIFFKLSVPSLSVKINKPRTKSRKFLPGELANGRLDFRNCAHKSNLPSYTVAKGKNYQAYGAEGGVGSTSSRGLPE